MKKKRCKAKYRFDNAISQRHAYWNVSQLRPLSLIFLFVLCECNGKSYNLWRVVFQLPYAYCSAINHHYKTTTTLCFRISRDSDWTKIREGELPSMPSLYRGTFEVTEEPKDTFLHMKGWTKGVCFINGHNLGRYWKIGPQETLYLPAPWLNKGRNEVCYLTWNTLQCNIDFWTTLRETLLPL